MTSCFGYINQFLHLLQLRILKLRVMVKRMKKWIWICLSGGEAGKIFGLLEGIDEMDEEECRKVVNGIKLFREGITKQMEGLRLQDEGLAIVQEAVVKHPLKALGPLLDAAMVGSRGSEPHPTASIGKHVKCKCATPCPSHLPPFSYL